MDIHSYDLLAFWNAQSSLMPMLSKIAAITLHVPLGSSTVERMFSSYNLLVTEGRSCMKDTTVCAWHSVFVNGDLEGTNLLLL